MDVKVSPQITLWLTNHSEYDHVELERRQSKEEILPRVNAQQEITRVEFGLADAPRAIVFADGAICGA